MNEVQGWSYSEVFEALVAGNLPPGTDLGGRYEIGELLGKGGVGLVYRATDHMLGEEVVLKILNPTLATDPDTVKRFKREIKICRKIGHPNVIRIYDIDEIYGTLFISMELVSGSNLKSLIRKKGRFAEPEGWELVRGMVQGLAAAHGMGIVHRDLKSQNVMVDEEGRVKLLDFGMARFLGMDHVTRGGDILGSPPYMSPEQAQGIELDHRTDIYSLGIILFEMFTGQLPFLGETPLATVLMQIDREPPRPTSLNPGLSPELERVILTCLKKKPEDRFQTVEELLGVYPSGAAAAQAGRLLCPQCGEPNPPSFRYCKGCGHSLRGAMVQGPRWQTARSSQERGLADSFSACLTGAVATCGRSPLPSQLRELLELSAVLGSGGGVADFRQTLATTGQIERLDGQLLGLALGLRHFTNRGKMRGAVRELLAGRGREELILGSLVGEVLSLLARQRSRQGSDAVTLRSLLGLLKDRLSKAFASEPWLLMSLETLEDPIEDPLTRQQFENTCSGQQGLLALHLLFSSSVPAPAGLEEMLPILAPEQPGADSWRTSAAALVGGLWGFWHGVEALPHGLLRRQPATGLAYDLGRELHVAAQGVSSAR
jgi:predicted Ser/Thr protein kinase